MQTAWFRKRFLLLLDCNSLNRDCRWACSRRCSENLYISVFFHSLLWFRGNPHRSGGPGLCSIPYSLKEAGRGPYSRTLDRSTPSLSHSSTKELLRRRSYSNLGKIFQQGCVKQGYSQYECCLLHAHSLSCLLTVFNMASLPSWVFLRSLFSESLNSTP